MGDAAKTVTRVAAGVSTGGLSEIERMRGDQSIMRQVENGVGGFVNDITGATAADAAGRAAMAQAAEARATREAIMRRSDLLEKDAMSLAQMSPDEMRAFGQSLAAGEKQLASDEKLLASIDPALMEASSKVLALMRGENARPRSMDALTAERNQQRQQLIDRLRDQLGPGAETSAVGLKALREFDIASSADLARTSQTFDMNDQAMKLNEMQSLSQIMGVTGSLRPDLMRSGMNLTNLSSVFRNRELNTRMSTGQAGISALAGASAPVIQSAGAQYVGDQLRAQGMQSLFGNIMNGGMMLAGKKMGAPTVNSTNYNFGTAG